ncbi:ParA family protein [Aurantivibrio plasticivorans]
MSHCHVYAVTNQKGGVGKTTTCVNLAASLVATKKKVLLVDMDPQGNATMGSGIDKSILDLSVYDVLAEDSAVADVVQHGEAAGYDVLPSNSDLTAAEVQMLSLANKEFRLKNALDVARQNYDYILIDCPPSLNMLTVNALTACDGVIIPMQCEYYALEGLSALMNTISQIQSVLNPGLHIEGLLRTMYDPRNSLTNDVSAQLNEHFGDRVYRTCIPRNVRLAEAPSFGVPVINYDRQSKGALSYLTLAGEIIRRNETAEKQTQTAVESPQQ